MPFDPAWPQNGQNIDADRFRGQFAGIIDLIGNGSGINAAQVDNTNTLPPSTPANANVSVVGNTLHFSFAIPQGQDGAAGQQGPAFSTAVVDSVTTLNPSEPATVSVSFDGTNVRFTFGIPRGNEGSQGPQGNNGSDGGQGPQGTQGPPFAQAVVDGVTTLDPGQPATVDATFDGTNVHFNFGLPRGNDGSNGSDGAPGTPGEVSNADLTNAINGTSNNTNAVSTLDSGFADPDMEALRLKLNEMILNGRR